MSHIFTMACICLILFSLLISIWVKIKVKTQQFSSWIVCVIFFELFFLVPYICSCLLVFFLYFDLSITSWRFRCPFLFAKLEDITWYNFLYTSIVCKRQENRKEEKREKRARESLYFNDQIIWQLHQNRYEGHILSTKKPIQTDTILHFLSLVIKLCK
jgi:hypothetical protein